MREFFLPKITVFEYSKQWKISLYVASIIFTIFFLGCILWAIFSNQQQDSYIFLFIGSPFLLLAILSILSARKTKISLFESSIVQDGIFWRKEIFYADIIGFTLANTNYTLDYHLKTDKTKIHIYSAFKDSDLLIQWMQDNFIDLDKQEENKMKEILSRDIETWTEKFLEDLPNIEKIVKIIWTYIPWLITAFFFFSNNFPFHDYLLVAVFFYPLISLFTAKYLLWKKTTYFTTGINRAKYWKNGAHSLMMGVFWMPILIGMILCFRIYESIVWFWFYELKVTFSLTLLYWVVIYKFFPEIFGHKKTISSVFEKIIWMIFTFFIIWGFLLYFNVSLDRSNSIESKTSLVIDKDISESSKWETTYSLSIQDWLDSKKTRNINVDKQLYGQTEIGNDVEIQIYPWKFGIRWFKSIIYTN